MKKLVSLLWMILLITGGCSPKQPSCDPDVMQAYNLRMQGKADQALALLDSILAVDSINAIAWFERSRVLEYMVTSGADVSMDEILASIEQAGRYDSLNVIYAYTKAIHYFLVAYIAIHKGRGEISGSVKKACSEFEHVLQLKPDEPVTLLQLVEIYGLLPPEMGGDSSRAAYYASRLEETNPYYAAKARLVLSPADEVQFWKEYLASQPATPDALTDLGVACLYADDVPRAEARFNEVMQLDSSRTVLLLDLARYYMLEVMQNRDLADSLLPISAVYIEDYLATNPPPVIPLQAYATGMLVKTNMFTGHKEKAEKLMEEAKALDPYFSRAFAVPGPGIFEPPDKVSIHFRSFFRPF